MRLSTSQSCSTSLLYTARMAARSVGAITSNRATNSISLIHTLAVSDPSIVIVVRFIGCTSNGETSAYLALKGGYVVFKFSVGHFRVNLRGGYVRMP